MQFTFLLQHAMKEKACNSTMGVMHISPRRCGGFLGHKQKRQGRNQSSRRIGGNSHTQRSGPQACTYMILYTESVAVQGKVDLHRHKDLQYQQRFEPMAKHSIVEASECLHRRKAMRKRRMPRPCSLANFHVAHHALMRLCTHS
jgi:hypothetical protein